MRTTPGRFPARFRTHALVVIVFVSSISAAVLAAAAAPAPSSAAPAGELVVPETGTPAERARSLWTASRGRILADAKAALDDAEYQQRRQAIWGAWIRLQMSVAGEDDRVSRLIPDVLGLLNDTYGWPADPPARRDEIRERKRGSAEARVKDLDARFDALKA